MEANKELQIIPGIGDSLSKDLVAFSPSSWKQINNLFKNNKLQISVKYICTTGDFLISSIEGFSSSQCIRFPV